MYMYLVASTFKYMGYYYSCTAVPTAQGTAVLNFATNIKFSKRYRFFMPMDCRGKKSGWFEVRFSIFIKFYI